MYLPWKQSQSTCRHDWAFKCRRSLFLFDDGGMKRYRVGVRLCSEGIQNLRSVKRPSSEQALSFCRSFDQLREPLKTRLFALRANDEPSQGFTVIRRLGLKEFPRGFVPTEL